ncbi:hypothetical protein [Chthonobacter albigriseus]|uniref:hypothetical protein n=1 Tax=Chthonobacter albigriseus TaxID=1683161 RepID=UPI0015EFA6A8|nr:hypothetical protein [Chthonobacter albigriseus]
MFARAVILATLFAAGASVPAHALVVIPKSVFVPPLLEEETEAEPDAGEAVPETRQADADGAEIQTLRI